MKGKVTICVRGCDKNIGKNTVLHNINLDMSGGRIYGFQGYNGSGKTMLLRLLCGLIYPTRGEVEVNGEILGRDCDFPKHVGLLLESPQFLGEHNALKNLKLLAEIQGTEEEEKLADWIRKVGLDPNSKKRFRKFSLGMKQRLGIAAAFMEDPEILLLDEPTNALDEKGMDMMHNLMDEKREQGALIVVTSHAREFLQGVCDEIYTMSDGEIVRCEEM